MAKKSAKISVKKISVTVITLLAVIVNCYLIYTIYLLNGIENKGRYLLMGLLLSIDLLLIDECLKFVRFKRKARYYTIFSAFSFIYIIISMSIGFYINKVYSSIDNVSKNYEVYSTSLVTLNDSSINSISDVKKLKIGIIEDTSSIDGYIISKEIIDENSLNDNELVNYSGFATMLSDLYDKNIDAIFISSGYTSMFSSIEKFTNISTETKVITSKDKKVKKDEVVSTKKLTEPFSILLMGVDSEKDGLDSSVASNGDSLIVVTFNPSTSNITMLSIPRDSYVPIMCFKDHYENKITHAAWNGTDCMIGTIENFLNVPIDYYVKINFKGVVGLVDALGGITANVPVDMCVGNSDRKIPICLKKGVQHLNGEQALVLSRDRHSQAGGDLDREQNQQAVIKAILDKVKNIRNIDQITDILNSISRNIDTNFSTDQILSFYNIGKELLLTSGDFKINSLLLQGNGQMIYDENMGLVLWDYILNEKSIESVSKEMRYNLNLEKPILVKEFSYSIDEPYVSTKTGSEYTEPTYYSLLPDFSTYSQSQAKKWLESRGYTISFVTKESEYDTGTIIGQSIPAHKRLDKITNKNITLTISSKIKTVKKDDDTKNTDKEETKKSTND